MELDKQSENIYYRGQDDRFGFAWAGFQKPSSGGIDKLTARRGGADHSGQQVWRPLSLRRRSPAGQSIKAPGKSTGVATFNKREEENEVDYSENCELLKKPKKEPDSMEGKKKTIRYPERFQSI